MRVNKVFKPWATCSTKAGRPMLENPILEVSKALLVSTDGRILSQLPVTVEEGDVAGYVPVDAIKAAIKLSGRNSSEAQVDCSSPDNVKIQDGRTWPRNKEWKFPDYEQVIPKLNPAYKRVVRIQFNPCLLAALFEAMGNPETYGAVLSFELDAEDDNRNGPVLVEAAGMSGVMMPMRLRARFPNRCDDVEKAHAVALGARGAPVEF